jgi:hypothetical protein
MPKPSISSCPVASRVVREPLRGPSSLGHLTHGCHGQRQLVDDGAVGPVEGIEAGLGKPTTTPEAPPLWIEQIRRRTKRRRVRRFRAGECVLPPDNDLRPGTRFRRRVARDEVAWCSDSSARRAARASYSAHLRSDLPPRRGRCPRWWRPARRRSPLGLASSSSPLQGIAWNPINSSSSSAATKATASISLALVLHPNVEQAAIGVGSVAVRSTAWPPGFGVCLPQCSGPT